MIIKDIRIRNFRSYYGDNHFEISRGLTLIIGDNGDGKTAFFEALEWLFANSNPNTEESQISAKRKSELERGEMDYVSVGITFEHNGDKEIERRFSFERHNNGTLTIEPRAKYRGYITDENGREETMGEDLLNRCFEAVVRKYCLFKGEEELNVFEDKTALKTLVQTFSDIRQFDDMVEISAFCEDKSNTAALKELRNDKKVSNEAQRLTSDRNSLCAEIRDLKNELQQYENDEADFSARLDSLAQYQFAAERYKELQDRLNNKENERNRFKANMYCNYNTNLLDEMWILRLFAPIIDEYKRKISIIEKERRTIEKKDLEEHARREGERRAILELANGSAPLPWDIPNAETMREMLNDHICKVCGHPAPEGSKEYEYMANKLSEMLRLIDEASHRAKESKQDYEPIFKYNYIEDLHNRMVRLSGKEELRIKSIGQQIEERLELIGRIRRDYEKAQADIVKIQDEINELIMQTPGASEELLNKNFSDFHGFYKEKENVTEKIIHLRHELEKKEERLRQLVNKISELEPGSSMTKTFQKIHDVLALIKTAFEKARDRNVTEFLEQLEQSANNYLQQLNKNDFYGEIRIVRTPDYSARIELHSASGEKIANPNGALRTTMYMSVLFAVASITTLKREQDYPLIFDAPTSSFGGFKEEVFYNVIDKIDKQCIIVTKDLIRVDKTTGAKYLEQETLDKLTCSVYRIEKATPFNDRELSTIRTIITRIK